MQTKANEDSAKLAELASSKCLHKAHVAVV